MDAVGKWRNSNKIIARKTGDFWALYPAWDVIMCVPKDALDHIFNIGPSIGYYVKRTKGVYLLSECHNRKIARQHKQELINTYGFVPDSSFN